MIITYFVESNHIFFNQHIMKGKTACAFWLFLSGISSSLNLVIFISRHVRNIYIISLLLNYKFSFLSFLILYKRIHIISGKNLCRKTVIIWLISVIMKVNLHCNYYHFCVYNLQHKSWRWPCTSDLYDACNTI